MKLSTILLVGSTALNTGLVALIIAGHSQSPATATTASRLPAPSNPISAGTAANAETWASLRNDDLAAQRDRLRAEGFPPPIIRAILAAQIRESFAARRKALDAAQANAPFWKNPTAVDPKFQAEFLALAKLEQKALKELLGTDPENGPAAQLRRQLPGIDPEKIEQLATIRERYDEQRAEFYNRGTITADEREKIGALEKAMHAEFGTVLSPQELEDYDLRASNTANNLRYNLTAFDATEAEFRALYRLQSAFDEQYRVSSATSSPEFQRARRDAQKQLNDEIASTLGPARYAEYQRSTDYEYRQATQLVARLELPPETANQLYAVQKDILERRSAVYSQTQEQRDVQLAALQQEAIARITPLLGGKPAAVEAYKMNGGSWVRDLNPPPPVPTPPPAPASAAKKS